MAGHAIDDSANSAMARRPGLDPVRSRADARRKYRLKPQAIR
jgi:hypothetical protein